MLRSPRRSKIAGFVAKAMRPASRTTQGMRAKTNWISASSTAGGRSKPAGAREYTAGRSDMANLVAALVGAACAMAISLTAIAAQADLLRLEGKIPLGNVAGRIDHMAFD